MFCTQCGAQQEDSARFCTVCGASLQKSEPTPVAVEEPASAPVVEQPAPAPVVEQPAPAPVVEQPVYNAQPVQPQQPVYNAQPVQPQQPVYGQPSAQPKVPGKGLAIAGMVLGIISLCTFWCWGIILGILAVVFGGVAKSKGYKGGMGTAAIVCGVIGIALSLLLLFSGETLLSEILEELFW